MRIILAIVALGWSFSAGAKIKVVTTTTDLRAIVAEVGGSYVEVESITRGTQDVHYIEVKPSFVPKVFRADLVVANGLDLESGWLTPLIRKARNPKVNPGQKGYLEIGPLVNPLEVMSKATRADGDVHPQGNPHVTLDPIRAGEIAHLIAERLSELDYRNRMKFKFNAMGLQNRLRDKAKRWQERIRKTRITKVVTYHKSFNYFLNRFGIENVMTLEPKPGIPPTSRHILDVINVMKQKKVRLILVENYFDPRATRRVLSEVPGARSAVVSVAVDGDAQVKSLDDLYERLVQAMEGKD